MRCYVPPEFWQEKILQVSGPQAHHFVKVLRLRAGQRLDCFDGQGRTAVGAVEQAGPKEMTILLTQVRHEPPSATQVTLAAAIPGQGKLDDIVNQATQMGVSRIIPTITERTVAAPDSKRYEAKQERLSRIAIEAAQQSNGAYLPEIEQPRKWPQVMESLKEQDLVLIATTEGPYERWEDLFKGKSPKRLTLLIGPEGDFTPEEIADAVRQKARRVELGKTILRCDTAVVAALSRINLFLHLPA